MFDDIIKLGARSHKKAGTLAKTLNLPDEETSRDVLSHLLQAALTAPSQEEVESTIVQTLHTAVEAEETWAQALVSGLAQGKARKMVREAQSKGVDAVSAIVVGCSLPQGVAAIIAETMENDSGSAPPAPSVTPDADEVEEIEEFEEIEDKPGVPSFG